MLIPKTSITRNANTECKAPRDSRARPGAGEKHREVADGAGRDGAGQPQQRERHRAAGPRSRPRLGRLRRGRGLGLHREAAAEERRSGGGGGGGEPASRQHFGLPKGKETKSAMLMLHGSMSAAGG